MPKCCDFQTYVIECFSRLIGELASYHLSMVDCRFLLDSTHPVYKLVVKYRKKKELKRKPEPFHSDDEIPF